VPNKDIQRTKKEAEVLAQQVFEQAKGGADFEALVKEHTNDSFPGIYVLTNEDAPRVQGSRRRSDMVARFGDVAFGLAVGEVGLATYHAALSPYGWHVIKRLE
jgi:parvulin-like peptidyl-prolyl isomerase